MRKIVYNNKLKKLIIATLIFIVLFNCIFPSIVMASINPLEVQANSLTGSIQIIADSIRTKSINPNDTIYYIRDLLGLGGDGEKDTVKKHIGNMKNVVIQKIKEKFPDLEESLAEKACNYYRNNQDMIEVKFSLEGYNSYLGGSGTSYTINFGEEFTQEKIQSDLEGKTDEEIGKIQDEKLDETGSSEHGAGSNPAGGVTNEEGGEEYGSDLGGILLSPVFYLINFIADAVISNLGNIMVGEWFDLGIGVLTKTKPISYSAVETDEYYVNVSSFAPDLNPVAIIETLFTGVGTYQYPNIQYTPEEIFSGQVPILSIDFISGKSPKLDANGNVVIDPNTKEIIYEENSNSDWLSIRKVISSWYKVLRMIAIIGLLSVLIYTGIKIIISANAKDKAKYKEWIINWFLAVAILFSMHYIMSFIISVTGEINQLLGQSCQGIEVVMYQAEDDAGKPIPLEGDKYRFTTNLMGLVRFMIQSENFYLKVGYEVMYIALIVYTVKFTMVYLKRVLNMAFLTLIAPIVALTYPIDKINDGKAQGFEMWLKEYIYNALLQPMHYVMYYILVGSAVSIAASNPLYGIVVLMFMTEAEKLLKKIFGFDKAGGGTVGGMAGAFAAGAVASSIKNIARMSKLPGGNGGKDGSGGNVEDYLKDPKPAYINDSEDNAVLDEIGDSSNPFANSQERQPEAQPAGTGASAANAFQDSTDPVANSEREALEEKLADGQLAEDDLTDEQKEMLGINSQEDDDSTDSQDNSGNSANPSNPNINDLDSNNSAANNPNPSNSDEGNDKWQSQMNGLKNVGKKLLKPVWDMDIENKEDRRKYNMKRLGKKVGRGVLGASLGIGAAAVQAGISITDGKYNPMEGVATFGAGYAGGGKIAQGVGSLVDTYREGRDEGNEEAIVKRARESWGHREDVIEYNKKKYAKEDREAVLKIQRELLGQGITSTDEMHQCIKYIKSKHDGDVKKFTDKDIKAARIFHDTRDEMKSLGIKMHKQKDLEEYIKTVTKGKSEEEARRIRTRINGAVAFDKEQAKS